MSQQTRYLSVYMVASILVLRAALIALPASAGEPSGQAKSAPAQDSAKPTIMKGPMRGEMKKEGMMKEDVRKAGQNWSKKMDEQMEREKMK